MKYHKKTKCQKTKECQNQHGFPPWMTNKFCPVNLSESYCDGKCLLSHGSIIDFIRDYKDQLKSAVAKCRQCQELRRGKTSTRRMSPGERGRDRPEGMDDYVKGWSEIYDGRQISSDEKRRERENLDGWTAHVSRSISKSERSRSKRLRSGESRERSPRSRSPRSRSRDRMNSRDSRDRSSNVDRGEREKRSEGKIYQIYVGKFQGHSITDDEIREHFQAYGNVVGLKRPSFKGGKAAYYCFVTFDTEGPAEMLLKRGSVTVAGQRVQIKPTVRNDPRVSPFPGGSGKDEGRRTRSSSRERKVKRRKDKHRKKSRKVSSDHSGGRRRRHRSSRSRTRSRTRSRSRDRSAESGEILELSSDPDGASCSAKSRLGPKPSRSRSSSSGSREWREVQESRSGNRTLSVSSKSPISKRLGPRIHTSSDEQEEGRVSVK